MRIPRHARAGGRERQGLEGADGTVARRTEMTPRATGALGHQREALVDLVELVGARNQVVEVELALHREIREDAEIDRRADRPVVGSRQRLLAVDHQVRRDRRPRREGRNSDDDGVAGRRQRIDDLQHGRLGADGVERVVDAESGDLLHRLHDVLLLGVDDVRGAEVGRELQLVVEQIDGDDGLGAGQLGALHDVEADAAAADDHDRRARVDLGMPHGGADARRDRAADDRRMRPRQIVPNFHHLVGGAHRVLGEGADAGHDVDRLAVELHAAGAVVHAPSATCR